MKQKHSNICILSILILSLAACQTTEGKGDKQIVGTAGGAVLGGLAGSAVGSGSGQLWATGAGVLLGALVGSEIGKSLDKADEAYAQNANVQAQQAPVGQTITWNNPDSGNYGSVTPVRDGYDQDKRYCREYQQIITIAGEEEIGYGTACLMPDGQWEIVENR